MSDPLTFRTKAKMLEDRRVDERQIREALATGPVSPHRRVRLTAREMMMGERNQLVAELLVVARPKRGSIEQRRARGSGARDEATPQNAPRCARRTRKPLVRVRESRRIEGQYSGSAASIATMSSLSASDASRSMICSASRSVCCRDIRPAWGLGDGETEDRGQRGCHQARMADPEGSLELVGDRVGQPNARP